MLEWIFFRALRKMPKSGVDHVLLNFFGVTLLVMYLLFKLLHHCRCGYATLHHVVDKSKEDRMESFFLSETCKYLYLVSYCLSMQDRVCLYMDITAWYAHLKTNMTVHVVNRQSTAQSFASGRCKQYLSLVSIQSNVSIIFRAWVICNHGI